MRLRGRVRLVLPTAVSSSLRALAILPVVAAIVASVAAAGALTGCGDEPGPGCRLASVLELARTPLSSLADVRLERVGAGFVLIGVDDKRETVRFARLDEAGKLTGEASATLPARTLGPWFAVTRKTAPGDQLLVVYGVAAAGATPGIALQVMALDAGASTGGTPQPLRTPEGQDVVLAGEASRYQVAMASVRTGERAVLVWGTPAVTGPPELLLLDAEGASRRPTATLGRMTAPWDCLAIVPGRSDFALSRLGRGGGTPSWFLTDLTDEGRDTYSLEIQLSIRDVGCPRVAPTAKGYTMAWQNVDGTYFADVDTRAQTPDAGSNDGDAGMPDGGAADGGGASTIHVTSRIVRGAVRFGGPDHQPPVACIASMGKEFSIAYDATSGPLVDRFTVFGLPKGSSLHLPSRGRSGGASAWPLIDAAYLTYLDRGPDAAGDQRYLAKVDCPEL
jgi:hypothetical protein